MSDVSQLITEHLDIWSTATEKKSSAGRGSGGGISLYGIKKLRELILDLAVRGRLVPQDGADASANMLLSQILQQQSDMYGRGEIKKPRSSRKIDVTEYPFEIPTNWIWCRISQLGHDWGQKVPGEMFTYIDVGAINNEKGVIVEPSTLSAKEAPSRARKMVRDGTVIYSTVRPYLLNIAVVSGEFDFEPIASTAFAVVHPFDGVSSSYLHHYFRSSEFIAYVEQCQTGIAYPAINDKQFFSGLVPLPPSSEQHRIVAKVDELMALCDVLEQQTEESLKAHQVLVETCLATLTNSQSQEEFAQNWSRIEAHFDTLFTTEESVDALKKVILQLAVMGKISSHQSNILTAKEVVHKVQKVKEKLVTNGVIRREKTLSPIDNQNLPFNLPDEWVWAKVGDIPLFTQYGTSEKARPLTDGIPVLAMGNIQAGQVYLYSEKLLPDDWDEFPSLLLEPGDLLYNRTNSAELVGKTGLYQGDAGAYTFASYLIRIRLDHNLIRPKYLNFVMNSPYFRDTQIVPHIKKQTGQANVNGTILKNMLVPVPSVDEQDAIIETIEALNKTCDELMVSIRRRVACVRSLSDVITL